MKIIAPDSAGCRFSGCQARNRLERFKSESFQLVQLSSHCHPRDFVRPNTASPVPQSILQGSPTLEDVRSSSIRCGSSCLKIFFFFLQSPSFFRFDRHSSAWSATRQLWKSSCAVEDRSKRSIESAKKLERIFSFCFDPNL